MWTLTLTLLLAAGPRDLPSAPVRCALVIGVDGLRADAIDPERTPRLAALAQRGFRAQRALNVFKPDAPRNGHSATNWGVLLTGVAPEVSGLTANDDREHRVGRDNPAPSPIDSIFGHVKRARPAVRTGVANTWSGIRDAEWTILGRDGSVIDWWTHPAGEGSSAERDRRTADAACAEFAGQPAAQLAFVHLSQVDAAGHAHSYGSADYAAATAAADGLVGELLDAVAARPGRGDEAWLVLVTSDHGGPLDGTGHADNRDPQVHTIPFVVAADGAAVGQRDVVPSLFDVAPTVLAWMGAPLERLELDGRDLLAAPAPAVPSDGR